MIERQWVKQAARFMRVYGSVPLFFYLLYPLEYVQAIITHHQLDTIRKCS